MHVRPSVQSKTNVVLILGNPISHYDIIQEGPFATVGRTWTTIEDGVPEWIVVKSSATLRKFSREPHDIVKECRLLSSMIHPNIVYLLGSFRDDEQNLLSVYMPYLPTSLASLLASPYFSPHPFPPEPPSLSPISRHHTSSTSSRSRKIPPELQTMKFALLARSILAQMLEALAYLHDPLRSIAHRDIKPENIMLTKDGCVKLIDFGVAWKENEKDIDKSRNLWPEYRGKLYFEVSTRAYRAPELLFGSRNYNHIALDLWSIGITLTEFFTPLRLESSEEDDGDDDDDTVPEENEGTILPFMIPRYLRIGYPGAQWKRDSLFDGQRGEIGLAWSIFKILGTPNEWNWPEFKSLPGASSVVFKVVQGVPLRPLLANLPPSATVDPSALDLTHFPVKPSKLSSEVDKPKTDTTISINASEPASITNLDESDTMSKSSSIAESEGEKVIPSVLDLIRRFLVYPAASRLWAEDALRHPWFVERLDGRDIVECLLESSNSSGISGLSLEEWSTGDAAAAAMGGATLKFGSKVEQKDEDPGAPLLLLPPGYALQRGRPDLKKISSHVWCGWTLGELLEDVVGGQQEKA